MKNIISLSGTHGTGKSSMAYFTAANLKMAGRNVVVCDELARECPLPINQDASELTQFWIISAQIKREIKLMTKYEFVISDRSVFDALAYGTVLKVMDESWAPVLASYVNKNYRQMYLLDPVAFNYHVADGIRDMDKKFRMDIHHQLLYLYGKYNVSYTLLNETDIDLIKNS